MKRNGFVVSAVLYPLLVLFMAILMGLLSMTDTRKRILDKMKLEISDSIFDEATCSCDTILNKLNYIIKNGTGGGGSGSLSQNTVSLNVLKYETPSQLPSIHNNIGDIAVITDSGMLEGFNYYISNKPPLSPKEGDVWIVQDISSIYYIESDYSNIGINYAMEYFQGKWFLKRTYIYNQSGWQALYYVPVDGSQVDLTQTNINPEIQSTYSYTGNVQTFKAKFSGYYQIELWGAQGGKGGGVEGGTFAGGYGAYTKGDIYLNVGDTLYLYVGEKGQDNGKVTTVSGGYNGGGGGHIDTEANDWSGGGGGATDVRLVKGANWNDFDSLKSRIMVAAGGAGGAWNSPTIGWSGAGGGLFTEGLSTNRCKSNQSNGASLGAGETGNRYSTAKGGGGGGYYGGTTISVGGPGCGGSSYISGHNGTSSLAQESTSNNIVHTGSSYHYSNYFFINTQMIDGNGYQWDEKKIVASSMPDYTGTKTMSGNTGNGYGKITLKTVEVKTSEEIEKTKRYSDFVFYYTEDQQKFTVPVTGTYQIELWGAQGGKGGGVEGNTFAGGYGAYTSGKINLSKDSIYYLYVGSEGQDNGKVATVSGGYNGGGGGHIDTEANDWSGGGGGATDIRTIASNSSTVETSSLLSRIMVAAGGAGGAWNSVTIGHSGNGGGLLVGGSSSTACFANQTDGSSLGIGETGTRISTAKGGGGGGWYGGTNTKNGGHGCGGTSYISGHIGCVGSTSKTTHVYNASCTAGTTDIMCSYSWTGYRFTDTVMIDGAGYNWTTKSGSIAGVPKQNTTNNHIQGYARITYLST